MDLFDEVDILILELFTALDDGYSSSGENNLEEFLLPPHQEHVGVGENDEHVGEDVGYYSEEGGNDGEIPLYENLPNFPPYLGEEEEVEKNITTWRFLSWMML